MSKRPSSTQRHPSATESGDGDPFLSRWARRKRIARSGADPDAPSAQSDEAGETQGEAQAGDLDSPVEAGEARELSDEDMPSLESIDENTDMSGFFSPKVTQAVKKAALRKFFHNPAFNVVDGLDDYDDDFRSFAALGDIITSDMRGRMEREAERLREASADKAADSPAREAPPAAVENAAESGAEGASGEDEERDQDAGSGQQLASGEAGVTRQPGAAERIGRAKLRPKGATGESS